MKIRKFFMPRFSFGLMAVILAMSITGCAANGPPSESTDVSTTSVETTAVTVTKPVDTSPTETEAEKSTKPSDETQGEAAATTEATSAPDVDQTEAKEEDPPATESKSQATDSGNSATIQASSPPETDPPETEPPETEPPHVHSYSATSTVAPGCECDGYTVYECSCGSSYTDDYVSAFGHSWGDWATTREPTSSAEGEKARTCSGCGAVETASIEKLPAEQIDTAALEAYGRQYGKDTYGFRPEVGTRAGYYPGDTYWWESMDEAYADVAQSVDITAEWLIAAGKPIVLVVDGVEYPFLLDVEVVHEGGNQYCVWVYYG